MVLLNFAALLIPLIMVLIGVIFTRRPPAERNLFAGYRTARSMKSKEAWDFANRYSGQLFFSYGIKALIASCIFLFLFRNQSNDFRGAAICGLCILQTIVVLLTIPPVEKTLKENFDEKGNPK